MARFGNFDQYLDNAGDPLVEGKLYFYESGTTTPKTTYSDINNSIPNTNPVLLSAAGRQPNIFFDGVAKVILTDNNDVQIAVRDPVGETSTDFGDEWVASKIYSSNDVVLGSDGIYYRSLSNGNQNNNPVTSSGFWTLLYSVEWNSGITYDVGAVVTYDNQQYQSLQASNIGNNPVSATTYWTPLNFAWVASATYSLDQNVVGTDGILYTSLQNSNTGNDPATSPAYWVGTSAAAAASATAAAASATAASASETAAATSATNAASSESAAATSATNSANSATASAASATASAASAAAAATSETNAATSASNSATSASASATSATASAASATAALASETAAAASETAAAASESAAATSATNAATSATASATSATNSANSATAAASSATDSANSATASAGSATAAAGSATSAANSATAAASSATDAATAETGAETALADFETQYLGASATEPTGTILTGALYFNTTSNTMFVYTGSSWSAAGSAVNGTAERQEYVATSGQTNFAATYDVGFVDVYLNGSKLIPTTDFTATDGATVVLGTGATTGDNVSIIAYGAFDVANTYTQAAADAKFAQVANNLSDVSNASTAFNNIAPSQTGNAGKYLTTDGSSASWGTVSSPSVPVGAAMPIFGITDTVATLNGGTYLRSGHVETNTSTYPDAPTGFFFDATKTFSTNVTSPYSKKLQDTLDASLGNSMTLAKYVNSGTQLYFHTGTETAAIVDLGTAYDPCSANSATVQTVTFGGSRSIGHSVMSENGLYIYGVSSSVDGVYRYSLSTAYDLSTISATYDQSFSMGTNNPYSIDVNPTGTELIIGALKNGYIYYMVMSTPYTLGSSTPIKSLTHSGSYDAYVKYIDNGNKLLVSYNANYSIHSLSSAYDVNGSIVTNLVDSIVEIADRTLSVCIIDHRATMNLTPDVRGLNIQPSTAFTFVDGYDVAKSSDTTYKSLDYGFDQGRFESAGTKLFLFDRYGMLTEYSLSTAYDTSTASLQNVLEYSRESYVNGSTNQHNFIFYNSGSNLYYFERDESNEQNIYVKKFALSTAYDLSTATLSSSSTLNWGFNIYDFAFNGDGTKLYMLDNQDNIRETTLLTAYDIVDTETVTTTLTIAYTSPVSMIFNSDGTKLYVNEYGGTKNLITYKLSTAYDISTAVELAAVASANTNVTFMTDNSGGWASTTSTVNGVSVAVGIPTQQSDYGAVVYMRVQ